MIHSFRCYVAVTALALVACDALPARAEWIADFENLAPGQSYSGPGGGLYENGKNLNGSFASGATVFSNDYNDTWGSWTGWSYSNTIDTFTAGYTNQYSAYALTGAHGPTNYAVGFSSAAVDLPGAPIGAHISNTTYGALSMIYGDQFGKKFGGATGAEPDWFLLTINGTDALGNNSGNVDFYLADYRAPNEADDFVVRDWTWVDLSGLGPDTRKLSFSLSSSDNGTWGMNTPAYFALDNLTTVPEPGTATLFVVVIGACALVGWRRRSMSTARESVS